MKDINITAGKVYPFSQYKAMDNRYYVVDVEVLEYVKKIGQPDMVKIKFQGGKTKTLAVNVFKSKVKKAMNESTETKSLSETLTESFVNEVNSMKKHPLWIEVDLRDARRALDIANDLRNSPHKMDGSDVYYFKQKDEGDALDLLDIFKEQKIGYDTNIEE